MARDYEYRMLCSAFLSVPNGNFASGQARQGYILLYEVFISMKFLFCCLKMLLIMKNRCCIYSRLCIKIGADATARMVKVGGSITQTNIEVYDL